MDRFRTLSLALVLAAFWLLLSGFFKPLLLSLGVLSVLLCVYAARRMNVLDIEGHPIHLLGGSLSYFAWLVWQIIQSTFYVSRIILSPSLPIAPRMIHVPTREKTDLGVNIYANSITLTPGTFTVVAEPDDLLVHALTEDTAVDLLEGTMDRKVAAFEGLSRVTPHKEEADA